MAKLTMSQGDLLLLLPLAWQQYSDYQTAFGKYKQRYTPELAQEALKRLAKASGRPDAQARGATVERTRTGLLTQAEEFVDQWNLLDGYIEEAWPAAVDYKAMREAAGAGYYAAATGEDWGALEKMMKAALGFVAEYGAELQARGEMPDSFAATLAAEAADVRELTRQLAAAKVTAQQGTGTQNTELQACLDEMRRMQADGQRLFRRQPEVLRLFQQEYLLGQVRGTGQAGVRGTLTLADGSPAEGVTVRVGGERTVSDEAGRYALAVPAGDYMLELAGKDYAPQQLPVTVEVGVKRRVDAVVGRMEAL